MATTMHKQAQALRYVPNPVYDRLAEIAHNYYAELTVADTACEGIIRRDLATLFAQVDKHMVPDDEDDDEVDFSAAFLGPDLPDPLGNLAQFNDADLLTANGGGR